MTIAVGIIGCGGIAEYHANGYLAIPEEAQVVAVSDVIGENARRVSEQVGGAGTFSDYRALLAEGGVGAVDICLPHHLHKDAILAAAEAGKQILCEKPLCLSLDEADVIRSAVAANGVTLMCAHNQLYLPPMRRAKEMLDQGELGKIYELRTADAFRHAWDVAGVTWRSRRETMGGGELIDTGYHPSYLLLYLAGSAPTEVVAMNSTHRLSLDGEDSAQVLVRFADGAVGNIVTSWAYDAPPGTWKVQVVGERGYLYADKTVLHYRLLGEQPVAIAFDAVNTFDAEIADFIACLRERRRPIQTEADGIAVLKVILGAYQSQAEKRVVSLGE